MPSSRTAVHCGNSTFGDMMIIFHYLKKYWLILIAVAALMVAGTYFELLIPEYLSDLLNAVTTNGDINKYAVPMIAAAVISLALSILIAYISGYLSASVSYDMRSDLFRKVNSFSEAEVSKFSVSSLTTRTLSDINQIQQVFSLMLQAVLKAPIMFIMAIVKIAGLNMDWSLVMIGYAVATVVFIIVCIVYTLPKMKITQKLMDDVTSATADNLAGIREVRAYNAEEYQSQKFDFPNVRLTTNNTGIQRALCATNAFLPVLTSTLTVVIYLMAATLIDSLTDTFARYDTLNDMIVFSTYSAMVFSAILTVMNAMIYYPQASVADKRIAEVISTQSTVIGGSVTESDSKTGTIEFRNVSFRYPGASADSLSDITFSVGPGQTVGIIGSTGCGKSSLVNLIPRTYDVTGGSVMIDGVDVREYDLDTLHSKIGFVPQKAILMNRTIAENVRYGDMHDLRTMEDVKNAVRIAQSNDFVESKPDGYDHVISENGTNLSGGQRQRLCIARAVCKRPEIYIFDDSFSALDYRTDYLLRKSLDEETEGVTTVIVSQRVSTIMGADAIIVLDNGRIVGYGTHDELLNACQIYREIVETQFLKGAGQ